MASSFSLLIHYSRWELHIVCGAVDARGTCGWRYILMRALLSQHQDFLALKLLSDLSRSMLRG